MKKILAICMAAIACALSTARAATLCSGNSAPTFVDLTSGTRIASLKEPIRYSTAWENGAFGTEAIIAVNGETVNTASRNGVFTWQPTRNGTYTLTHRVLANGQQVGVTLTAVFEFRVSDWIATPVITPADGTILEETVSVLMSCATEGATIHYTTDGTDPTVDSPEYRRFRVAERTTVKAVAVKNGLCSEIAVAEYALGQCEAPVITAEASFTGSKTSVSISCATEGATIRYTTDGSDPDGLSALYTEPFDVTGSCTVKAYTTCETFFDSAVASFAIEKVWGIGDTMGDPDQVFTVGGDLPFVRVADATAPLGEAMQSGAITHNQASTMTTTVNGAGTVSFLWRTSCEKDDEDLFQWDHAEFEVDGAVVARLDGVTEWQTVSQAIAGEGFHTLVWRYVKDDVQSAGEDCCRVADFRWALAGPETPVFSPEGGVVSGWPASVTISCATTGATIHYTTDGTDPTEDSPAYRRIRISERTTVKAVAVKDGRCSEIAVAEYALGQCADPVVAAAATFTGTKTQVALSCATEGAILHYTLDGSTPDAESDIYSAPFFVVDSCMVKAIALYPDYFDSAVVSFAIEKAWGIGDTMGAPDQVFTVGGDLLFVRVDDATAPLGESMRSGAITHSQTSTLSTAVSGPGTISFQWKTSCEDSGGQYDWDHAEFEVDGEVMEYLDGETAWQTVSREISDDGSHTLVWRYVKDDMESEGEDCCWVADYHWTSAYTETQTTPKPVPYAWLRGFYPELADEYDAYESAALATAANGRDKVWECYVAGISPTNEAARFEARIDVSNGVPVVTWTPDLNEGGTKAERVYTVEGQERLGDGWGPTNAASRFFRVKVALPGE